MKKYTPVLIQSLTTALILLIGFFVYGKLVGPITISSDNDALNKKTFTVEGTGKVEVTPDKYYTDVNINETGKTQEEAKNNAATKQQEALAALKKIGFQDKEIKTTGINVNEDYSYGIIVDRPNPTPSGYRAYYSTQITSKSKEKVEQAIDELTKIGINVNGVQSTVGDTNEYMNKARTKAIQDAKKKAESMAEAAGFKIGGLASIKEGNSMGGVEPMPMLREKMALDSSMSVPTEINPGIQEISATVSVTYYIRD